MKISDACQILGLSGDITPELTKTAYRKACSLYHPDRNPAGLEMMQAVNQAYDVLRDYTGSEAVTVGYDADLFAALTAVIDLGLTIEVCGAWVWVSGDTKPHKDILKAAGYKWAMKKLMWFYRPADYKSFSRGSFSIDEIRSKHGSETVRAKQKQKIAA